jgi:murein L,D-transpeptidase YcbB/YkuD
MNKAKLLTSALALMFSAMTTGCAPMISGVMNAALDENAIYEKTAAYFNVPRSRLTITDIKNDVLASSYKATVVGKAYKCSIYYGEVKCSNLGHADSYSEAKAPTADFKTAQVEKSNAAKEEMSAAQAQARLNQLGFPVGKPDGIFGKRSIDQLKAFQKARGLEVTGVLNSQTIDALK